jgi:predicted Zn finger-like uncharacterized protein
MILTCPECATRYLIDPAALLPDGRNVRCAKCNASWLEAPPSDMPKRIEVEPPPRLRPLPTGSNLPALNRPPERNSGLVGWLVLIVVVLVIGAGGWFGRTSIVALWPPAAELYALLGVPVQRPDPLGLRIEGVHSSTTTEGSTTVLVVTGQINNPTHDVKPVPKIRVGLRNAERQEIYHWVFAADDSQLAPEGKLAFTTKLPGPPAEARDLTVDFVGPGGDKP